MMLAASEMFGLSEETMQTVMTYATKTVMVLVFFLAGWIAAGWMGRLVGRACDKAKLDLTLGKFFSKMVRWIILLMVVLACLGAFGVETTSFAAVFAAAGFAVGMAMQGTLSNFAAGVMLLVFRPFKVGDVVSVAGQTGKVNEIELFTTTLDTPDNRRLILPNSNVFGAVIENISFHERRRADVNVGVDYSADIDQTRSVLLKAAMGVEGRLEQEEPQIVLTGLGGSSVDWQVRVWCHRDNFWPVKDTTTRAIKVALDEAGIGIPFPQMDVHLDGAVGQA